MEWKLGIESVNKDKSHSWCRISHGLKKLVTDFSNNRENDNNEQATSEFEDFALKPNVLALWRSDQRLKQNNEDVFLPAQLQELYTIGERTWTDIETENYSPIAYSVSKQLSTLLRHRCIYLETDDGAIEILENQKDNLRNDDYLRNVLRTHRHWSDEKLQSCNGNRAEETRKRCQYLVLIRQDKKFFTYQLFKVIQDAISLILHYRTML